MFRSSRWFLRSLLVLACAGLVVDRLDAEEHEFVLCDATAGTQSPEFVLNEHVDGEINSKWKVAQRTLQGGLQDGVRLIEIDNGQITVFVIPTRGMSVLKVTDSATGERLFGWDSPVKEIVHPKYVDLESRGGLGWLQGFNEWMVRCGLEYAGHPGTDRFVTNTGDESELDLTLHGKVGNLPASKVELLIEKSPPYRLRLRGVVQERMFYGPKLHLVSELSLLPNEARLSLNESITNHGASRQEYQIIYHTNFGAPILEEGAGVVVAADEVTPMNAQAAKSVESYATYKGPTLGFLEEVYLVKPHLDSKGMTSAVLHNASQDRGAKMSWSTENLPYLTIWKNTAAEEDGYVTGIEPGSGFPFNRRIERHFGRVPSLAAGESHRFEIHYDFLADKKEVREAIVEVEQISAGRAPKILRDPPVLPEIDD